MARRKIESAPLGTLTPEQREAEIKQVQNDALAGLGQRALSEETGALTSSDLKKLSELSEEDIERAAIQAESDPARMASGAALSAGFFGRGVEPFAKTPSSAPPAPPAPPAVSPAPSPMVINNAPVTGADADEVTYTTGEEMYGRQGTFSSYRVGPITLRSRLRPGETHAAALSRLRAEAAAFMVTEREAKDLEFKTHFKKAFG
jgi:hypothetical protein